MALGVTEEHRQLAESVGRWAADIAPPNEAARATLDGEAPDLWGDLANQGLLGLHLPEEMGGAGYGLLEAAVVAERLGNACVPAPFVSAVLASELVHRHGADALAKAVVPALADGSRRAASALDVGGLDAVRDGDRLIVRGEVRPVQDAAGADLVIVGARDGDGEVWVCLDASALEVSPLKALDSTRSLAKVVAVDVEVPVDRVLDGLSSEGVRDLALVLYGAEAAGVAAWCTDTAAEYAKVREQFGRPIGQFQGVKHLCAQMLVRTELAQASAWDAAQAAADGDELALAAAVAGSIAIDAAHTVALDCVQVLGGIGFTWEHDAHIFLRRGTSLRQLLGGPSTHRRRVAELALSGHRRTLHLDLGGDEVDRARAQTRDFITSLDGLDDRAKAERLADEGYVNPHWPRPFGREASPVEQLVIDDEFDRAGVHPPKILIGGWILPTIIGYGTEDQKQRFVRSTLVGDIVWCQLFSEPGAGSDLAAVQMKAVKVDGGWELTGQKIWTSLAHRAQWGLCIARTDPTAAKHDGITAFLIDMQDSPGLDIRPLKELTGNELFNEVFFDQVFVPDELVVGPVNGGWKAARTTLANERVAMSKGSSMGASVESVLAAFPRSALADDPVERDRLGKMVAEGLVLSLVGHRITLAQLGGVEPGSGSSVRKFVGGHHSRECSEYTLELLGPEGATTEDEAAMATYMYLQTQCLTIAGGTTNVQLNVIAERLLGLPRDESA